MGLRRRIKRLARDAREDLESFELLDGSTYCYDRLETYKVLFLHAHDVQVGGRQVARTTRGLPQDV